MTQKRMPGGWISDSINTKDILMLIGFAMVMIAGAFLHTYLCTIAKKYTVINNGFFVFIAICFTPYGQRFVRFYYGLLWLLIAVGVFSFENLVNEGNDFLPFVFFLLYQLIRFIFWKVHKADFVPLQVSRFTGMDDRYSELVQRAATEKDVCYMVVLLFSGSIIFFFGII